VSSKRLKISVTVFFQYFNSLCANFRNFSVNRYYDIRLIVSTKCKPYLLYGSEIIVWDNSQLSTLLYPFSGAIRNV